MKILLRLFALALSGATLAQLAASPALAWEHWGGDAGGTRFSPHAGDHRRINVPVRTG